MSKIEEISYLKLLQGKTGGYSDSAIKIDCGIFYIEEEKGKIINSEITIKPQRMRDEKKTAQVLKEILEDSKATEQIENIIVKVIEEGIIEKIRELRKEVKEILGIKFKEVTTQEEQENLTTGGVDYEIND